MYFKESCEYNRSHFVTSSINGKLRAGIQFVSSNLAKLIINNSTILNIVSAGLRAFARCKAKKCNRSTSQMPFFRFHHDITYIPGIVDSISTTRIILVSIEEFMILIEKHAFGNKFTSPISEMGK